VIIEHSADFAFTQNECTQVEDGSYYCQKADNTYVEKDDLFAAPDADGDLEIYLRRNGVETKLTNNQVDDASPFYDPVSDTIVWHRLVNDRYQIISFDVDDGSEEQITDTKVNNMEPTRSGDVLVWQRWVAGNWEIIMQDDGEERQLTQTQVHDIAPSIRGNLIIWNVRSNDGSHSLMTYDRETATYNAITDADGVSVSNPRMVVVYDAVYKNGDTVVKGFDVATGEVVALASTPPELPAELPTPDSTGEVRALPGTTAVKPQQDDAEPDEDLDQLPEPQSDLPAAELDLSVPTTSTNVATSSIPDLDLRPEVDTFEDFDVTASTTDLILPTPPATTTSSSTQS